ncbi:MAG: methyltransferase domain-containing protein [Candidatus Eremiobacteraeota bacterium]|nr:methyltransferase domain-containing protein [Candidatus Eremiobacteraeota bacterium]
MHLQQLGVGPGWRCLEVGAGGGSIARWLAERVAPSGSVQAVDLDTRLLEPLQVAGLTVRRLDVCQDELPSDCDLVHARLLLEHLPEREAAFGRMVRALRPGGWLVVTDSDFGTVRLSEKDGAFYRVASAFDAATRAAGWDPQFGPALASMFENAGLVDVTSASMADYERGGPHATLLAISYVRLRDILLAQGARSADIDHVVERMKGSDVGTFSPTVWTARGRRFSSG